MADWYVDSNKTGGGDTGADWPNAFLTLAQTFGTVIALGDRVLVSANHVENFNVPGGGPDYFVDYNNATSATPAIIISCTPDSDPPTYQFGARINAEVNVWWMRTWTAWFGMELETRGDFEKGADRFWLTEDCRLVLSGVPTPTELAFNISGGNARHVYVNTRLAFTTGPDDMPQQIGLNSGVAYLRNFDLDVSVRRYPNFWNHSEAGGGFVLMDACDLVGMEDNSEMVEDRFFTVTATVPNSMLFNFFQCGLSAGSSISTFPMPAIGPAIRGKSCAPGSGVEASQIRNYQGDGNTTRDVYRSATFDGSTGYSLKIDAQDQTIPWMLPYEAQLAEFYLDTANPTLTIELLYEGATRNNDEIWAGVSYPDATDPSRGQVIETKPATVFTAASPLTSSSAGAWTHNLTTPTASRITVTVTGGGPGAHRVSLYVATGAAFTCYADMHIDGVPNTSFVPVISTGFRQDRELDQELITYSGIYSESVASGPGPTPTGAGNRKVYGTNSSGPVRQGSVFSDRLGGFEGRVHLFRPVRRD